MGARVALSREQLLRLMHLVEAIAAQRGGDVDAAITFLQDSAAAGLNKPSYKSIAQFAAGLRAIRLRRNELLGTPVFRDPAWDMPLDLVQSRTRQDYRRDVVRGFLVRGLISAAKRAGASPDALTPELEAAYG